MVLLSETVTFLGGAVSFMCCGMGEACKNVGKQRDRSVGVC